MTGFISVVSADRVDVFSDTATYDEDGIVLAFTSKIRPLPGGRGVIFTRGMVDAGGDVEEAIADIFAVAGGVDLAITDLKRQLALRNLPFGGVPLDVSIAAISERDGPRVYTFQTADYGGRLGWFLRESTTGFSNGVEHSTADRDLLVRAGVTIVAPFLMEEMRKTPGASISFEGADEHAVIGGSIEHTAVTVAGVNTRTIHNWTTDRVGENLILAPSEVPGHGSAWLAGARALSLANRLTKPSMSRQQRRAAERQNRRAA
ncbi:hypothetical protein [Devosia sp. SD17-2]|uniref:hypothetical protein n=1 Tax=Devosia sp. SD17-2 TaxID=2976459 RepID=UPI0023D7CC5E|nr:hypothetical protein [Devosia sp. SD17-2]WEJ32190.1 hypothetical protein NYQ88_14950 [Devosia sp. SD17-2]